jgi:hypothetical protein
LDLSQIESEIEMRRRSGLLPEGKSGREGKIHHNKVDVGFSDAIMPPGASLNKIPV